MKKTDAKKLSICAATVRRLAGELTPEQLKVANGAQRDPDPTHGCGSVRAVC